MGLIIKPRKLQGIVNIPPSKSIAHRMLIAAFLAGDSSSVRGVSNSKDIQATINAIRSLGNELIIEKNLIKIGSKKQTEKEIVIDSYESGSTLRFFIPLSLIFSSNVRFKRQPGLASRPLEPYYQIFDKQGIKYYSEGTDLCIEGNLKADDFLIPGNISSQFITGLLFALPLLDKDSTIRIVGELESKAYIDLTLQVLQQAGIEIINNSYQEFIVRGNQHYKILDYKVEGDYSQAAFFLVAGALGNDVWVNGLDFNSLQGDKIIIDYLKEMNCEVITKNNLIKCQSKGLVATSIDASFAPDIIPVLSLAMANARGCSKIINAQRLRIKECDRLMQTRMQLNNLNADVLELVDSLIINGPNQLLGGTCSTSNDHRMAMMLAIASSVCKNDLIIDNYQCVSKSYPNFWDDFKMLGGVFNEFNMEK